MRREGCAQKKRSSHRELKRIAVKWCGLLQGEMAFNHCRQSSPEDYRQTYHVIEGNKVKYTGLHKQGLHCSRDTLPLPSPPINYQCGLITWLITALNCLCSHGSTAIFTGKLWTQWKVWQSWWLMVFVLLESVHLYRALAGSLEWAISVMAVVYTSRDSQFPEALEDYRIFFGEKKLNIEGNIIKRHQTLEWRPWNRCCFASFSAANHLNQLKNKCWLFTFMNSTDVFKPTFIWFQFYVVTLSNFWSGLGTKATWLGSGKRSCFGLRYWFWSPHTHSWRSPEVSSKTPPYVTTHSWKSPEVSSLFFCFFITNAAGNCPQASL